MIFSAELTHPRGIPYQICLIPLLFVPSHTLSQTTDNIFRHALSKHKELDPTGKAGSWGDEVACFEMSSPEPSWLQNRHWEFIGS